MKDEVLSHRRIEEVVDERNVRRRYAPGPRPVTGQQEA
jgi:hypothetical protein